MLNNTCLGMLDVTPYIVLAGSNTIREGNRNKLTPMTGLVTMPNASTFNFTSSNCVGIEGIMPYGIIKLTPTNKPSGLLQGSAKHIVCTSIGADMMQLQTSDGVATGVATAIYKWDVTQ